MFQADFHVLSDLARSKLPHLNGLKHLENLNTTFKKLDILELAVLRTLFYLKY